MRRLTRLLKDKERLYKIFSGEDEKWSKPVDIVIMVAIFIGMLLYSIESQLKVDGMDLRSIINFQLTTMGIIKFIIIVLEYLLTTIFAIEFILRLYSTPVKRDYLCSFFGVVDFLATWPVVFSIFFPGLRYFSVFRTFRLIRVFRVLKLFTFINEGTLLLESIRKSMTKIIVYFLFVVVLVCIIGTMMFMVEHNQEGTQFTDIPTSIYWAIVTLTTVGYGDITPITGFGRFLSGLVMILGYTIIAIPTGIVSANIIDVTKKKGHDGRCPRCNQKTDLKANYCKHCGERL